MVDNASGDDSVAWTRARHPRVEVIETGANLRWAGGNNAALERLAGEGWPQDHVLLLNNDTVVPPASLARLGAAVATEPRAWVATPRITYAAEPSSVCGTTGAALAAGPAGSATRASASRRRDAVAVRVWWSTAPGARCCSRGGPSSGAACSTPITTSTARMSTTACGCVGLGGVCCTCPGRGDPAQGERVARRRKPAQGLPAQPQPRAPAGPALAASTLVGPAAGPGRLPRRPRGVALLARARRHGPSAGRRGRRRAARAPGPRDPRWTVHRSRC